MKKQLIPMVAALLIVGSVAASASIPGSDGIIHACYRVSDGRVRLIDPAHEGGCGNGEAAVSWNNKGKTGPRGPKGVRGVRGLKGVRGLRGPRGPIGHRGPQGQVGPKGVKGDTGTTGAAGTTVTHLVGTFDPSTDPSGVISWTQPANTIATVYYRVNVTTPGGSCVSGVAEHVGNFQFWLNSTTDLGQDQSSADLGPSATQTFPAIGSNSTAQLGTLFPGSYQLTTEFVNPGASVPASDCTGTVVQTQVFVQTALTP